MSYIEHLIQHPLKRTHQTPILFQHGAWHSAACWSNWMDYFAQLGYEVHAISLPGHGRSPLHKRHINRYTMRDYTDILAEEIAKLDTDPILIGHSMGGVLLQRYLESHTPPAAVLVSSIPITGVWGVVWRLIKLHPLAILKVFLTTNTYHAVATPELVKSNFFTPAAEVDWLQWHEQVVRETSMVVFDNLLTIADKRKVHSPVLVVAGGKDALVSVSEQRKTAKAYSGQLIVCPGQAHNLMAEPQWRHTADLIHQWLTQEQHIP